MDISTAVKDVLERLRTARQEKSLADGCEVPVWVFSTDTATPFDHARVGKVFKRVPKVAGLPVHHNSPHSLRHTFASLLLQQGESPAYVQRQLGHTSIKLTVDTYGRRLPMGNKAAVDRLDEGFVTPDDAVGSRLVATAPPGRGRGPQVVEGMVRPARFERATYRFVVCCSIQLS